MEQTTGACCVDQARRRKCEDVLGLGHAACTQCGDGQSACKAAIGPVGEWLRVDSGQVTAQVRRLPYLLREHWGDETGSDLRPGRKGGEPGTGQRQEHKGGETGTGHRQEHKGVETGTGHRQEHKGVETEDRRGLPPGAPAHACRLRGVGHTAPPPPPPHPTTPPTPPPPQASGRIAHAVATGCVCLKPEP
jgi:hypothetical protein